LVANPFASPTSHLDKKTATLFPKFIERKRPTLPSLALPLNGNGILTPAITPAMPQAAPAGTVLASSQASGQAASQWKKVMFPESLAIPSTISSASAVGVDASPRTIVMPSPSSFGSGSGLVSILKKSNVLPPPPFVLLPQAVANTSVSTTAEAVQTYGITIASKSATPVASASITESDIVSMSPSQMIRTDQSSGSVNLVTPLPKPFVMNIANGPKTSPGATLQHAADIESVTPTSVTRRPPLPAAFEMSSNVSTKSAGSAISPRLPLPGAFVILPTDSNNNRVSSDVTSVIADLSQLNVEAKQQ
jgi:hypothetical protein